MSVSPSELHRPCPILVINLAGSTVRWQKVSAALEAVGLTFERHEASDGRLLSATEIAQLAPWNPAAFFKPLSPGEVGCCLSHVSVVERIVREGWERTLVLEDDFLLADNFVARLKDLLAVPGPPADLIKIEGALRGGERVAETPGGQQLYRHRRPPSRTAAQLWSLEGARKFLASAQPFLRPVDVHLKHWWEHDLEILYVRPSLVMDGDATGVTSTIGARPASGLGGACRRLRYKTNFAFASQWHYLRRYGLGSWCRQLLG
jgi:glycosyl transferase family 25